MLTIMVSDQAFLTSSHRKDIPYLLSEYVLCSFEDRVLGTIINTQYQNTTQ